ncbi:MAG: hypothetical protein JWO43_219 [Candidatus Adlerbacteria bacterium]|nr:hypothetical protein [Candidatus Adlerbacteria bacterium]
MNNKWFVVTAGVIVIAVLGFLLLDHTNTPVSTQKISVATSFYPLYFFASQIGGDKADVLNITPAGGEPHDYEPTAQDIARIENSKILILNGGGLEAWGDKIKQNIKPNQTLLVTAGEGITTQEVVEDGKMITDPHTWLSPPLVEQIVDKIEKAYEQVDPANTAYYQSNTAVLKSKLNDLDAAYMQGLASCKSKDIITSHAAFGYLATTYHLNQVPISGLSPDAEPSAQQLVQVAKFAKDNHIKYIFFESLVSPKLSQTIATEVGAQTLILNPIEGLTPEDIAAGKTYFTEMANNLVNLRIALLCQ